MHFQVAIPSSQDILSPILKSHIQKHTVAS